MLYLRVIDDSGSHFVIGGNESFRLESSNHSITVAHVYAGHTIDPGQEPVFVYDGTLPHNHSVLCLSRHEREQILASGVDGLASLGLLPSQELLSLVASAAFDPETSFFWCNPSGEFIATEPNGDQAE